MFENDPAILVLESFVVGRIGDDDDLTVMHIARIDDWMTALIDELPRKMNGIRKGGSEALVLKGKYEENNGQTTEVLRLPCRAELWKNARKRRVYHFHGLISDSETLYSTRRLAKQ